MIFTAILAVGLLSASAAAAPQGTVSQGTTATQGTAGETLSCSAGHEWRLRRCFSTEQLDIVEKQFATLNDDKEVVRNIAAARILYGEDPNAGAKQATRCNNGKVIQVYQGDGPRQYQCICNKGYRYWNGDCYLPTEVIKETGCVVGQKKYFNECVNDSDMPKWRKEAEARNLFSEGDSEVFKNTVAVGHQLSLQGKITGMPPGASCDNGRIYQIGAFGHTEVCICFEGYRYYGKNCILQTELAAKAKQQAATATPGQEVVKKNSNSTATGPGAQTPPTKNIAQAPPAPQVPAAKASSGKPSCPNGYELQFEICVLSAAIDATQKEYQSVQSFDNQADVQRKFAAETVIINGGGTTGSLNKPDCKHGKVSETQYADGKTRFNCICDPGYRYSNGNCYASAKPKAAGANATGANVAGANAAGAKGPITGGPQASATDTNIAASPPSKVSTAPTKEVTPKGKKEEPKAKQTARSRRKVRIK